MAIERESAAYSPPIQNRKGNRVTEAPVFIRVPHDDLAAAILFFRKCPDHRQAAREEPFAGERPAQLPQQQRVGFHFDVVRDEAWPLLGRNLGSNCNCAVIIGIVRIQQRDNCAGISENASPDAHASRIACLSRTPGVRPPLRPAPIKRKMGCLPVKAGISVTVSRVALRVIVRPQDGVRSG